MEGTTVGCVIQTSIECRNYYFAGISSTGGTIYAVEPKTCLLLPIWGIVTTIMAGLITIGIITIILVKLAVYYLDYREVKKFKKELSDASYAKIDNPLFHPATVVYSNVAFDHANN